MRRFVHLQLDRVGQAQRSDGAGTGPADDHAATSRLRHGRRRHGRRSDAEERVEGTGVSQRRQLGDLIKLAAPVRQLYRQILLKDIAGRQRTSVVLDDYRSVSWERFSIYYMYPYIGISRETSVL